MVTRGLKSGGRGYLMFLLHIKAHSSFHLPGADAALVLDMLFCMFARFTPMNRAASEQSGLMIVDPLQRQETQDWHCQQAFVIGSRKAAIALNAAKCRLSFVT